MSFLFYILCYSTHVLLYITSDESRLSAEDSKRMVREIEQYKVDGGSTHSECVAAKNQLYFLQCTCTFERKNKVLQEDQDKVISKMCSNFQE